MIKTHYGLNLNRNIIVNGEPVKDNASPTMDSEGNQVWTYEDAEGETVIDKYMYRLEESSVSLRGMKLLGYIEDFDYDRKLKDILGSATKEEKTILQKYIKEYIRADYISSRIHRRKSPENICETNEDWIDG